MTKILVPVDGSDSSANAVKAAIQWFKERGDFDLHIITVQPPIVSGNITRFVSAQTINEYYQEEGRKALDTVAPLLKDAGIQYKESVESGQVAQVIAEYIKKNGVDYLIMGTRGLSAVSGLLLGSVTTKVLSLVDIPVTLVK